MAYFLSPVLNEQQFDANGDPLAGGQIETYLAGTLTPVFTYKTESGTAHTNPIVLDSAGYYPTGTQLWLEGGSQYKFIVKTSVVTGGVTLRTIDNITGINDSNLAPSEWVQYTASAFTYLSPTSFSVVGDQTNIFQVNRRVQTTNTGGTAYGTVVSAVYGAPNTVVTLANTSGALDSGLSAVYYSLISSNNTSLPIIVYDNFSSQVKSILIGKNMLINGNFSINQRAYVSGVATVGANQYTLDRWRVVTSGQNLTFAASGNGNQITAPASGVEQVIEGINIEGGSYVLNWTGTATATVNGVAKTKGEVFTLPANTNATVRLIGGTASLIQLESGTVPTLFDYRMITQELALCQRYFYTSLVYVPPAASFLVYWGFKVTMRISPTITGGGAGFVLVAASAEGSGVQQTTGSAQTLVATAEL